jgi:hypothetical protein
LVDHTKNDRQGEQTTWFNNCKGVHIPINISVYAKVVNTVDVKWKLTNQNNFKYNPDVNLTNVQELKLEFYKCSIACFQTHDKFID